jgi:hypothetical protein
MSSIPGEQEIDVLFDFLNAYLNRHINVSLGHYDLDDDMFIVINGTLVIFDDKFLRMRDVDGKDTIISLKHVRYVSEGWSDDVLRVEREVKA